MNQLPLMCVTLIKAVVDQPINCQEENEWWERLYDCDYINALICTHLTNSANVHLCPHERWEVSAFVDRSSDKTVPRLGLKWIYRKDKKLQIMELRQGYNKIVKTIQHGWKLSHPKDHINIRFKEDHSKYSLYVHRGEQGWDPLLIGYIAEKFDLSGYIFCNNSWYNPNNPNFGCIYIWIKKSDIKQIINVFGFVLE